MYLNLNTYVVPKASCVVVIRRSYLNDALLGSKPKSIYDKTTKTTIICRVYEFTCCIYAPTASKKRPNNT